MPGDAVDMRQGHRSLSIIVPALNEADRIRRQLAALDPLRQRGHEVIVVDGGSADGTAVLAQTLADVVLTAPRGRASQMNAGALSARGDVLLFLHVDTQLPNQADELILQGLVESGRVWGRFDVVIEDSHPMLAVIAWFMNRRSRLTGIATGDQAMFVCRDVFLKFGGFPDIPLMEDIAISRTLKTMSPPLCLRNRVITSGRRWEKHGILRTLLKMWCLRLAFFLGADPARLAKAYGYAPREDESCRFSRGARFASSCRLNRGASPIAIAVFARAPVSGQAKTRLIPSLGQGKAADLQRAFIQRTLQTAQVANLGPVFLWCAPDCAHPVFAQCRKDFGVTLHPQCEGDLGERMFDAFAQLCQRGLVLLIGADCPALTPAHLDSAARALREGNDAVLLPAEDGGYVLIGLRRADAFLFSDMPWGSREVLAATRERLQRAAWRWEEPALLWDVDNPDDVERLRASGLMDWWFAENAS